MTELKCPICERDMVFIESPDGFDVFVCTNSKCECCGYAGKNIWKYIADTKKKLDIAVDALKSIDWCAQDYANAQGALDDIIPLEQINQKEEQ